MSIRVVSIYNRGDHNVEFVLIKVEEDCNLRFFAIADTTYVIDGYISNRLRHLHWFVDRTVEKGEYIYLRTCAGTDRAFVDGDGDASHEIFWGLNAPVWNNAGDGAVLFSLDGWATTRTP